MGNMNTVKFDCQQIDIRKMPPLELQDLSRDSYVLFMTPKLFGNFIDNIMIGKYSIKFFKYYVSDNDNIQVYINKRQLPNDIRSKELLDRLSEGYGNLVQFNGTEPDARKEYVEVPITYAKGADPILGNVKSSTIVYSNNTISDNTIRISTDVSVLPLIVGSTDSSVMGLSPIQHSELVKEPSKQQPATSSRKVSQPSQQGNSQQSNDVDQEDYNRVMSELEADLPDDKKTNLDEPDDKVEPADQVRA